MMKALRLQVSISVLVIEVLLDSPGDFFCPHLPHVQYLCICLHPGMVDVVACFSFTNQRYQGETGRDYRKIMCAMD